MVVKKHIDRTLQELESKYQTALLSASHTEPIYCCKLATLEYCGWIEEALDLIVKRSLHGKLRTPDFRKQFDEVINKTHGFQYREHFRLMLCRSVGLQKAETIERSLSLTGDLPVLISQLEALKIYRNAAAHTWLRNATLTFPAPASLRSRLHIVCPILRKIYSAIIRL